MTTTIKVKSANYPALVQTFDVTQEASMPPGTMMESLADERVLWPKDGEQEFYCTTSRVIRVTDLEYDDPRA